MRKNNTRTVKFLLSGEGLPVLTRKQLKALRKLKDDEINYSDIPPR